MHAIHQLLIGCVAVNRGQEGMSDVKFFLQYMHNRYQGVRRARGGRNDVLIGNQVVIDAIDDLRDFLSSFAFARNR